MSELNREKGEQPLQGSDKHPGQKIKRRTFIIDKAFQAKFMITWLLLTLGFVTVIFLLLIAGLKLQRESISDVNILKHIAYMMKYNAIFIVIIAIFLSVYILLISHRIAGPVFRLKRCIDEMKLGKYDKKIILRKKDYLKDLAESLNQLNVHFADKFVLLLELRERIKALRIYVDENDNVPNELRSLLRAIEDKYQDILLL